MLGNFGCGVSDGLSTKAFVTYHDAAPSLPFWSHLHPLCPHFPPSSTLASWQFFKHTRHIRGSGLLHLLFFSLEHPSPIHPRAPSTSFQSQLKCHRSLSWYIFMLYNSTGPSLSPLFWLFSSAHITTWPKYKVFIC